MFVTDVAFSPDGRRIVSASDRGIITQQLGELFLWDRETGERVHTFQKTNTVNNLALSSDGRQILTSPAPYARLWDVETGEQVDQLQY